MQNWNKLPRFVLVLILFIGLCASLFAPKVGDVEAKPLLACPGGVITQWTFTNTVIPSTGSGTFSSGNGLVPAAPPPYTFLSGSSISFSSWNTATLDTTAYLDFQVDTSGRSDIFFNFDYRATGTGPITLETHYSIDGINYIYFSTESLNNNAAFHPLTINLSSISALNDNPNSRFRMFAYGASGAGGTLAIDNVTISEICPPVSQVIINEVAWVGTNANPSHEWIELYNNSLFPVDLTGWRLVSSDSTPDIILSGTIPAGGYFLLERDENATNIPSDLIYTGALSDTGESLYLYDNLSILVDSANGNGGAWPAGSVTNFASMERIGTLPDSDASWFTNNGVMRNGLDFNEDPIWGTPRSSNSLTPTPTSTITPSPTNTFTPSPTLTLTPTITPTGSPVRSVIINEIAWAGTASGLADDEWIELYNTTNAAINITGWKITASDGTPNITLNGTIPAGGYFLLERGETTTDDTTVSDISSLPPVGQIYTGNALSNSGETLTLYDSSNRIIDTANGNGGAWPAGSSTTYGTMERILNTADSDSAWTTNNGTKRNGLNANGGNILGTPKQSNSVGPTPTPTSNRTSTPTIASTFVIDPRPIINEILARPGFDWNQDGREDVFDEFIEIKNISPIDISLSGWKLDKLNSTSFSLPDVILKPNERIAFYSLETNLLLSDGGETVRLINPSGRIYDAYTYTLAKEADKSFCRLPDGNVFGNWFEDCIPTPNLTNTREGKVPTSPDNNESPVCDLPDTIPADFFFAECGGYGANIWNPFYWDQLIRNFIQSNTTKWETFIE